MEAFRRERGLGFIIALTFVSILVLMEAFRRAGGAGGCAHGIGCVSILVLMEAFRRG